MLITKRNGDLVPFDPLKICNAIHKAFLQSKESQNITEDTDKIASDVLTSLPTNLTVESVQDLVEVALMKNQFYKTAKIYILYRSERSKIREKLVSDDLSSLVKRNSNYFDNDCMREFMFYRTYSRWIPAQNRREVWEETVDRYMSFMRSSLGNKLLEIEYNEVKQAILAQDVMPSMRLAQFSGPAAERCNVCVYNCAFTAPETFKDLTDIMYISMCGTGVGFSVEAVHVEKFPVIQKKKSIIHNYQIQDSKEGWCDAFEFGLNKWYEGEDVNFDYSLLRPAGARLKTMGGRSSGPQPLIDLMEFTRDTIFRRQGYKLSPLNMYDIICKIGQIVVSGGVRRCIAAGSKVITLNDSFKNIEDIVPGDKVLTYGGWKPVVRTFNQGLQRIMKIYHQEGVLECTPNHRVAVFTDINSPPIWKEASTLVEGDILGFPTKNDAGNPVEYNIGRDEMPTFKYIRPLHSTTCKDIVIPPLDEGIAWLIGNFQGDGYVGLTSKSGELSVAVHGDDIDQKNETEKQLRRFGVNTGLTLPRKDDNSFRVRVKSKQLAVYFHTHVKQPKVPLKVPEFIKRAGPRIKACFVQGLMDADGSVKTRPIQIVTTVYPNYAKEIQALLMSIGITTRLGQTIVKKKNWKHKYQVHLINNRDKELLLYWSRGVGFKKYPLQNKVQRANGWCVRNINFNDDFKKPDGWKQKVNPAKKTNVPCDSLRKYFGIEGRVLPIKVKRIVFQDQSAEFAKTYDIEVEGNHNFVCSGVLVHNSAMISLSGLSDLEIRDAKKGAFWKNYPQRSMANNSAVYNEKPTMIEFMNEWLALAESGTGERGIFNRGDLKKTLPPRRLEVLGSDINHMGSNPCVTADTWVHTVNGPRQVADLIDIPTNLIVNGQVHSSSGFFHTGKKLVYDLRTKMGYKLKLTANHKLLSQDQWVELENLMVGNEIALSNHQSSKGWVGDGNFSEGWFYEGNEQDTLNDLEKKSSEFQRGFLRNMLELNEGDEDQEFILTLVELPFLECVQRMLLRFGIKSTICGGSLHFTEINAIRYWHLTHMEPDNISNTEAFTDTIAEITPLGEEEVYDVTVEGVHEFCANGIRAHNCGEILLKPMQFCNLSEVVCRPKDNLMTLMQKARIATIIGTYQASLTDFKYISPKWKENQDQERLLGVSLTGQWDCDAVRSEYAFEQLRRYCIDINQHYANRFGINRSTCITCIKPSGSVSQLTNSSSGIHPRFSPYYIRRIRISATDPLLKLMRDQGYPCHPEVGQSEQTANTFVLDFPVKSPEGSICANDMGAIEQLEYWKKVKVNFTEHNPSVTIYIKSHEWLVVAQWVWDNWEYITGLSFLPYSDHIYQLAPYEKITKEQYEEFKSRMNPIDFSKLIYYETTDSTDVKREVACAGGVCEL